MILSEIEMRGGIRGTPLFVEIPVDPHSAPYLVLSNKGLLWVNHCFDTGVVRSALLTGPWADLRETIILDVVRAVRTRGVDQSWGNVFPYSEVGVAEARDHLKFYGFSDTDLLTHSECSYIPDGSAVVVPKDRNYLGVVALWDGGKICTVVVHNPARGMAVLGDW